MVNQTAMFIARRPCVFMIVCLLLGCHSLCLARKVLSLAEGAP
jgi:hypothetical protein